MAGLPLVGAMFGLCLGGPVGLLAGAKLGGVAAVGGSILGYAGASVIKEQKDLRKHIDDHYKKEPDLYVLTPKEEAMLNKRRAIPRTPMESTRHLPTSGRSSPARFRRQLSSRSCCSLGTSSCRSYNSAGVSLGKEQEVGEIKQTPDITKSSSHRRLGDLTEDEQRSVLALICRHSAVDERQVFTFEVSRPMHDINAEQI